MKYILFFCWFLFAYSQLMSMKGQEFLDYKGKSIPTRTLIKRPLDIICQAENHLFTKQVKTEGYPVSLMIKNPFTIDYQYWGSPLQTLKFYSKEEVHEFLNSNS